MPNNSRTLRSDRHTGFQPVKSQHTLALRRDLRVSLLVAILFLASCGTGSCASEPSDHEPAADTDTGNLETDTRPDTAEGPWTPDFVDVTESIAGARKAAIGDLSGDGASEIVVADDTHLRVLNRSFETIAELEVNRGPNVLVLHTFEDGTRAILAGWGRSMQHVEAASQIVMYTLEDTQLSAKILVEPETERHEVVAIVGRDDGRLLLAWFEDNFNVKSVHARRGDDGFSFEDHDVTRMATSWAVGDVVQNGEEDVVVGRLYGDEVGTHGRAFVWGPKEIEVPTLRGVRGLVVHSGDPGPRIFLGDGWHQNYGRVARAQVSAATPTEDGFETTVIDTLERDGEFTVWELALADATGQDNPTILLGRTDRRIVLYSLKDVQNIASIDGRFTTFAVGDLDGKPGDEVLVVTPDNAQWFGLSTIP